MKNIEQAKEFIKQADAILITAGAGIGVDSGLPDFRSYNGFWRQYPVLENMNLSFEEIASPMHFTINPPLAWAFYGHRLNMYRETKPHEGFRMLLDLVRSKDNNYFIYTSNVDGAFQKAGFDENNIYEIHGSIHYLQCSEHSCKSGIWENNEDIEVDMDKFEAIDIPICKECGDIARPNILMFWDGGFKHHRGSEQKKRYSKWLRENRDKKIAIIEVGAGINIPTVRQEGKHLSFNFPDAKLIRINPKHHSIDDKTNGLEIPLGGLDGLTKLLKDI
jgi:NAD-dependent SIR2 family protein deacetylase